MSDGKQTFYELPKEMNEFLDGLKALENQIDVIKSMQVGKNIDECCCRSYGRQ